MNHNHNNYIISIILYHTNNLYRTKHKSDLYFSVFLEVSLSTPAQMPLHNKKPALSLKGQAIFYWCRGPESNRYGYLYPRDFKSRASASSATSAEGMEATPGIEPGIKVLQTSALPLGYVAVPTLYMAAVAVFPDFRPRLRNYTAHT